MANLLNIKWGFLMKSRKNTIATQIKQIYHNLLSKYEMAKRLVNYVGREGDLAKYASIMLIATLIAGVCNYVYQIHMGVALGPEDYGVFGALFAIFYIISILGGTIQTSMTRFVSKLKAEDDYGNIGFLLSGMTKRMAILGVLAFFIFVLASPHITSFLNMEAKEPVIIVGATLLFSLLLPVGLGVLQGLQRFVQLGMNGVLNASLKLLFGIILVSVGFGVSGALGAVVIATVFALIAALVPVRSLFKQKSSEFDFFGLYKYTFPAMVAMFCFTVPANVDVIIVKHFFAAHDAGLYTATSVLGKIIIFLPMAISKVMFPKVSEMHTQNKGTFGLLNRCLIYTGMLSGVAAIGCFFFPSSVAKLVFGSEYIGAAPLIRLYGVAMFFFSLTVVVMFYNLAVHSLGYVYIFAFFTFLLIGLLSLFHSSMMEMITILVVIEVMLFFSSYLYTVQQSA